MAKIILYGVAIVLVTTSVVMGMDAYSTYQDLQGPAGPAAAKITNQPAEPIAQKPEKKDYDVIVRRNLFASASLGADANLASNPKPRPAAPRNRSKKSLRSLNVTLVGTTVGPGGMRYAILEEAGSRRHAIHRVGDRVQDAVIQSVERGEVRLNRNGRIVILRAFERGSSAGSNQSASLRQPAAPHLREGSAPPRLQRDRSSRPRKLTRRLNRSRLESLTGANGGLESQLRVVAYRGNAGEVGVRVFPSGKGRLIRHLGLRGGDIIFEIDGAPVTSRDELQAALMNILSRNEAMMKISRRGKRYDFVLRIQ
ncbi:MAG: type II secretion system protein N [bacterium]